MITLRRIKKGLQDAAKIRAIEKGETLEDYIVELIQRDVDRAEKRKAKVTK